MVVHFPGEDARKAAHHDAKRLFEEHKGVRTVREELDQTHGHRTGGDTLHRFEEQSVGYKREDLTHNNRVLAAKETLERVAFGIGNLQLLNVLLITVIPNYLIAGILLGLRSIVSGIVEAGYGSFSKAFAQESQRSFWFGSGLGYAFILSAVFITLSSIGDGFGHYLFIALFAVSFLSIGIFGALYLQSGLRLKGGSINKDRMSHYVKWITYYGIVFVAVVFLAAGFILDLFAEPIVILMGDRPLLIYGYAVLLFITGIVILITAYLATNLRRVRTIPEGVGTMAAHVRAVRSSLRGTLAQGAFARSMLIAGVLFYSTQLALNYYLGIHLYDHFDAFTPVAVLFAATLLTMFVVPLFFDKKSLRLNGRSSLFMFGAGLTIFIPISFMLVNMEPVRNALITQLAPVTILASSVVDFFPMVYLLVGIAGSSIAGIAFSRLALDTMKPEDRSHFMRSLGTLTPLVSGVLIMLVFSLRWMTSAPIASFFALALALLVSIVIFASLIAGRLEERFEQQAITPHKV